MKREEEIVNASIIYSEYEYNQIDFKNGFLQALNGQMKILSHHG